MGKLVIGSHVKRLRLEQHRTQQEIADKCGFTKSLLSKIESNKVVPPVATLVKIAGALGVQVSALIEEGRNVSTAYANHAEADEGMVKTERGYWIYPFASSHKKKKMQPFVFVARKGEVKKHDLSHGGEEFIYVLEGEIQVKVGDKNYQMKAGDSIYFNAVESHQVMPVTAQARYLNIFV